MESKYKNNIFLYSFTSKYRTVIVDIIFGFSILKEGNCFSYQINWHIICAGAIFIPKPFAKNLLIWHDVLSNFAAINCCINNLYLFMTILPPSRILRWNWDSTKLKYNWEINCFFLSSSHSNIVQWQANFTFKGNNSSWVSQTNAPFKIRLNN